MEATAKSRAMRSQLVLELVVSAATGAVAFVRVFCAPLTPCAGFVAAGFGFGLCGLTTAFFFGAGRTA
jgi:hypothetical protein